MGIAYRFSDKLVIRTGYGISYDPYNLLRAFRVNYPEMITTQINSPNSYVPAGALQDGIPPIVEPNWGNGKIPIPGNILVNTIIPDQFRRGYVQSWNFTAQSELGRGWNLQAGYVGTRSVGQLAYLNRNAGFIGGGVASQPLNLLYGRTAYTNQITGLGTYTYDGADPQMTVAWRAAHELGLMIQMHCVPHYASQIGKLAAAFRQMPVLLDHLARPGEGTAEEYEQVLKLGDLPNVYIKFSGTGIASAARQGSPHPDARQLVRRVVGAFGASRVVWGELGINVAAFEKAVAQFDSLFDFASDTDKAKIRGRNSEKLFAFA